MLKELLTRYPTLVACRESVVAAGEALIACYEQGGKLLLCGNGGSCADCDHIAGELMKGFLKQRPLSEEKKAQMKANCPQLTADTLQHLQGGLPALALPSFSALNSAFCNDVDAALVYAQPLMALAKTPDVLLAISTSGNSRNVLEAVRVAKGLGIRVIGLTGQTGGQLRELADICICAPERETFKIQELHLPIYHYLCAAIEQHFFGA